MIELKENLPVLIVLAGLPGTGKTTLAKMLSNKTDFYCIIARKPQASITNANSRPEWLF